MHVIQKPDTPTSGSSVTSFLATRTSESTSPAACVAPNSCFSKCSACYTMLASGNTYSMKPGSVSGCTCYAATMVLSGAIINNAVATFADGSTSSVSANGCVVTVQTKMQGATCTSTYAVTTITGTSDCPSGAASCPSSTNSATQLISTYPSSANSGAASSPIVGMLFSVMISALVATKLV
jgi:hypothetical protein